MVKILIIRTGRVGDMVMITPALQAILQSFPDCNITLLTSNEGKRVLADFDKRVVASIIYDRKKLWAKYQRSKISKQVTAGNFDLIFCFETKKSFSQLFSASKAKVYQLAGISKAIHYAQHCFNLIQSASEHQLSPQWAYLPVATSETQKAQNLGIDDIKSDDFIIGMHPSYSGLSKMSWRNKKNRQLRQWPPAYFAQLAQLLNKKLKNHKFHIIMDLLPEDQQLGEQINRLSGGLIKLIIGKPNFARYKAVIARMDLLITPDTGPMHVAAAVGTKMVAIFSHKSPADCGPYMPADKFATIKVSKQQVNQFGLAAISPQQVLQASIPFLPED